jgi:hypothetical protein
MGLKLELTLKHMRQAVSNDPCPNQEKSHTRHAASNKKPLPWREQKISNPSTRYQRNRDFASDCLALVRADRLYSHFGTRVKSESTRI